MKKFIADLHRKLIFKNGIRKKYKQIKIENMPPVNLPADDAFLPNQEIQWWYWTGHLKTEEGKRFGFEIVFFAFDSWCFFKNQLAQAAVTNVDDNSYSFREHVNFLYLPKKLDRQFELESIKHKTAIIKANGKEGNDQLYAEIDDYILNLKLESLENPVLHYDGKAHPYCFGGYTYYYSREKMKTIGTLSIKGKSYTVEGTSWFDRQYGNLYNAIFKGWQWFAIELNDGRQIMLYDFLHKDQQQERFGSVTKDNQSNEFGPDGFNVEILGKWKSPNTKITYPSGWRVKVGNSEFIVEPAVQDQELRARHNLWIGPEYWEGDCFVKDTAGNQIGEAYVELNGFGNGLISFEDGFGI